VNEATLTSNEGSTGLRWYLDSMRPTRSLLMRPLLTCKIAFNTLTQ